MSSLPFAIAFSTLLFCGAPLAATLTAAQGLGQQGLADLQSPPTLEERDRAVAAFSAAYLAGRYADAVEPAQRVVAIGERLGLDGRTLGTAYNNLGTVQLKLQDLKAAERSFRQSAALIESAQGDAAETLIAPLGGLGVTLAAQQLYGNAIDAYSRALAISRRTKGLHNADQLGLIESLCSALQAIGDVPGVDRERQYAIQVFENAFGADDLRVAPAITTLAYWYEQTRRYQLARDAHEQVLAIAERAGDDGTPLAINALRGVARSYRLAYAESSLDLSQAAVAQPRLLERSPLNDDGPQQRIVYNRYKGDRPPPVAAGPNLPQLFPDSNLVRRLPPPEPQGRRAIDRAVDLADRATGTSQLLRAATLIDAGDWYTTAGDYARAVSMWSAALPHLPRSELHGSNPLARPRLLVYHTPQEQVENSQLQYNPDATILDIELAFTVTAEGKVADVRVVRSDADPAQVFQSTTALRGALYAPRFEDGRAVDTRDVTFVSTWYRVRRTERVVREALNRL